MFHTRTALAGFGALLACALAPAGLCQVEWEKAPYIGNRGGAMAFDAVRGRVILCAPASTWEWDGQQWTELQPLRSPTPRRGQVIASDLARGRVLLFGGQDPLGGGTLFNDTWEWDGVNWNRPSPTTMPSPRRGHAMAYDAARGEIVLFGGRDTAGNDLGDTWVWNGVDWAQRSLGPRPAAIAYHAMTYDARRGVVVLFGGDWGNGGNDTWEWDGTTWTQRRPARSPPGRKSHAMAYDVARSEVVLFGGETSAPVFFSDTWVWGGTNWTQRLPAHNPPARYGHGMAYDYARGRVVLYGSGSDTWEWDGVDWIEAQPPTSPGSGQSCDNLAYDVARGRVVLCCMNPYSRLVDTWEWDGVRWMQRFPLSSPGARVDLAVAYDATRRCVVLFGGWWRGIYFTDTWEWDGVNWNRRVPASMPSRRCFHRMAYDERRGRVLLFGGVRGPWIGQFFADTWEWDGVNWVQRVPANSPPARAAHALAYDAGRGVVVLFGGDQGTSRFSDTWEWDGANWMQRTPSTSPPARCCHGMAYDSARERVVLYGGNDVGPRFTDTWEWDGVDWTRRQPNGTPTPNQYVGLAYDSARERIVMYASYDYNTWEYGPVHPAAYSPFGTGCPGSAGIPVLHAAPFSLPWIGDSFSVQVRNLPPVGTSVFLVAGWSNTAGFGAPLPLALTSYGMPGCNALGSWDASASAISTGPTVVWSIPINNNAQLVGMTFHQQALVFDPNAGNPAGAIVSNAATGVLGAR